MTVPFVKLNELVEVDSGYAFKSRFFTDQGDLPVIRIRDVVRGYSETYYTGEYDDHYLVDDGDMLIGMDGEFNLARWKGGKSLLNQRVCRIRPNVKLIDKDYIFYFLPKKLKEIEDKTPHVTVKHLSVKAINEIEIPLPSLKEQKRIAETICTADSLLNRRKDSISIANKFLRSVFLDMFGDPVTNNKGWDTGSFQDIAKINPGVEKMSEDTEVSFIPMQSVSENSDEICLSETRMQSEVKTGFTSFLEGDVLFAKITPCMENGKAGIARGLTNGVGYGSTEFHVFRPLKDNYAEFIYTLIHLDNFKQKAANSFSGAVGHKRVPKDFLIDFALILPPYEKIIKFCEIFRETKEYFRKMNSAMEYCDDLFKSIIQKAYKGEL